MKSIQISFAVILCFTLFACNNNSKNVSEYISFEKEILLTSKKVKGQENIMCGFPSDLFILDTTLLIFDRENKNPILKCSFPIIHHKSSYGVKGNGPGEFLLASQVTINNKGIISFLDGSKRKIIKYDMNGTDNKYISETAINTAISPVLNAYEMADNKFIIKSIYSKYRVYIQNKDGEILDSIFQAPKEQKQPNHYQLYDMNLTYDSKSNVIAGASLGGEVLDIYNFNTKKEHRIVGPGGISEFDKETGMTGGQIEGFYSIKIFNDKIYALYSGIPIAEMMNSTSMGAKNIQVYDLLGTPLIKYKLDRQIVSFYVDTKNNTIYGLDANSETPIYVFSM